MNATKTITNSFHDFHLLEISKTTHHPEKRGPFMVSQSGSAPGDPELRECIFVLTKRGTWMHLYIFFLMSHELRHRVAVFDSAAEVMQLAETLVGKPVVETMESLPELLNDSGCNPAHEDPVSSALMEEIRKKHPKGLPPSFG